MMNKKEVLGIFKIGITLFLITAIAALVLAVVNSYTAPVIAENTKKREQESMQTVLVEAKEFKKLNLSNYTANMELSTKVTGIYEGVDNEGNACGYAVMVSPNGYGGEIAMVVGVSQDAKVLGVDVISQSETAGLGSKCNEDSFKSQFIGKSDITVVKSGAKDNEINAITGATRTSKAVTDGVNTALLVVENVMRGEIVYE